MLDNVIKDLPVLNSKTLSPFLSQSWLSRTNSVPLGHPVEPVRADDSLSGEDFQSHLSLCKQTTWNYQSRLNWVSQRNNFARINYDKFGRNKFRSTKLFVALLNCCILAYIMPPVWYKMLPQEQGALYKRSINSTMYPVWTTFPIIPTKREVALYKEGGQYTRLITVFTNIVTYSGSGCLPQNILNGFKPY